MATSSAASGRVYPNAPIVEAVIDIQVSQEVAKPLDLSKCVDSVSSRFPQRDPIHLIEMEMASNGFGQTKTEIGQRLVNETGDRILQLQQRGFTYSHMPPYSHWDSFRTEALPLWRTFVENCQPHRVTRVAVRYINRLKLPSGKIDLEDYLSIYPHLPKAMPIFSGLLMQIQMRHEDVHPRCRSVITIASEQATDPSYQPLVLDLDVLVDADIATDSSEVWELLDKLRVKKNDLFEASLTDKMKETFI